MIPKADIVAWRHHAPWVSDAQVEQDLIISRALVAIYENEALSGQLAFRGGTALHKLYFKPPKRYSEDIDLVQIAAGAIGPVFDALQRTLNLFLGTPKRKQTEDAVTLSYRVESEGPPAIPLRMKVEINTREHKVFAGLQGQPFSVTSRWFSGSCVITTYSLEELLATKVRALYQRRKGRDLFDLWLGLEEKKADAARIVEIFKHYMKVEGNTISRSAFEKNLHEKIKHPGFSSDLRPLLPGDMDYDDQRAFLLIRDKIIKRI